MVKSRVPHTSRSTPPEKKRKHFTHARLQRSTNPDSSDGTVSRVSGDRCRVQVRVPHRLAKKIQTQEVKWKTANRLTLVRVPSLANSLTHSLDEERGQSKHDDQPPESRTRSRSPKSCARSSSKRVGGGLGRNAHLAATNC